MKAVHNMANLHELEMQISAGLEELEGMLALEPEAKKKCTLQECLAQCDPSAPLSEEDTVWTASTTAGRELL